MSGTVEYPSFNIRSLNVENIPHRLREIPQWLMWRWVNRGGKRSKPPFQINGNPASPTDENTWSLFDEVVEAFGSGQFSGIGIALTVDLGIVAWDLDHCIDAKTGKIADWALHIVTSINSYTEITPSGEGLRILLRGDVPKDGIKKGPLECYKHKRYVTITGQHLANTPKEIEEVDCTNIWNESFLDKKKRQDGEEFQLDEKFKLLKEGKYAEAGFPSHSEADLSYCGYLANIAHGDPKEVDRLFRQSKLYREKWDTQRGSEGVTYGQLTIAKALENYKKQYHLTDTGNAKRFASLVENDVRFCKGRWYIWDKKRFKEDDKYQIYLLADRVIHQIYDEASKEDDSDRKKALYQWGRQLESRSRIESMLKLSQARFPIPIVVDELDADPLAINCDNGILRGTDLYAHDQTYLMTKLAPVAHNPKADAPLWQTFLDRCIPDKEVQSFLQRSIGYSLTGSVKEQKMFFLYGLGANGKSTFINVIMKVMGDYARFISSDVFIAKNQEGHPTAVCDLLGVRLAVCPELEEGKRFNEQSLKWITGGEKIKARRLYQDFMEFENTSKIWIIGNHKPQIRGTDFAIWRRILLIPFEETIPIEEQDKNLLEKLYDEIEGIFNWCVSGYHDWLLNGLKPPNRVIVATEEYRVEQDSLQQFLDEEVEMSDSHTCPNKDIYRRYSIVTKDKNEFVFSNKAFCGKMRDKGFKTFPGTNNILMWRGFKLKVDENRQSSLGEM